MQANTGAAGSLRPLGSAGDAARGSQRSMGMTPGRWGRPALVVKTAKFELVRSLLVCAVELYAIFLVRMRYSTFFKRCIQFLWPGCRTQPISSFGFSMFMGFDGFKRV